MAALLQAAIKSLDNLNDQIVQFVYTPSRRPPDRDQKSPERELTPKDHDTLRTSMSLMRHLLVDAQVKFRKMVEDNKRLAARIDGSIQAANQEVKAIRDELEDTNRRLTEISMVPDSGGGGDGLMEGEGDKQLDNQEREELFALREENTKLGKIIEDQDSELFRLRDSNNVPVLSSQSDPEKDEVTEETMVVVSSSQAESSPSSSCPKSPVISEQFRELQQQVVQANQELTRAMEALQAMKMDRKRLQSDKLDLLSQLRQLYCTLEDKDSEIRDFIRNFEHQMRESNDSIKMMAAEKEESEHEKWEMLRKAQDASERCVFMKAELQEKDSTIASLEHQLRQAQEQLKNYDNQLKMCNISVDSTDQVQSSTGSGRLKSSSVSEDSVLKSSSLERVDSHSPSSEDLPPYQEVIRGNSGSHGHQNRTQHSDSSHFSFGGQNFSQSLEHIPPVAESSRSSDDLASSNIGSSVPEIKTFIDLKQLQAAKKRRSTSALSRLFGKSRTRRSIAVCDPSIMEGKSSREASPHRTSRRSLNDQSREASPHRSSRRSLTVQFHGLDPPEEVSPRLSMLSEDNYQSRLEAARQARDLPVTKWRAGHVLAWLEVHSSMPMYGRACSENIKSGKVLLGLSDSELDSALCLDSPLHRRKLRLAIEELRDPTTIRYARASQLDHTWVAHRWLADLGLPQYSTAFEAHLVDGRLLNVLTKKDLERHLGVQRRFHQNSILYGVELLRRLKFNKEELSQRRAQCETVDTDTLVWTNHRLLQWLQAIDLHEYVKSLHESGIHGAILVLEHAYNAEAFATALNIPQTKSYVRRHLASELDSLIRPARASLEGLGKRARSSSSSLNRSFIRSYRGGGGTEDAQRGSSKRLSFRGSLGRALGRKSRQDETTKSEDSIAPSNNTDEKPVADPSKKRCHSMEVHSTPV